MIALLYLCKVIVCSALLYGYYHIALRNNRFHHWNRYYLVLITLVSLLVPLLRIPLSVSPQETSSVMMSYTTRIITLREAVMPAPRPVWNYRIWLAVIYIAVLSVLLIRLLLSFVKIKRLISRNTVQEVPPYRFVTGRGIQAPFSFFSYIFWNNQTSLDSREGQQILKHELVHLKEKHSADKMLLEIVTACCWINPFFHLIKRELSLVHEFIADQKAAGKEVAGYAETILQMAFQSKQFTITNDFFHPPIKRRIVMLTKFHTPRFSYLRRIMVLPLAAFIFCSLAFVADKHPSITSTAPLAFTPFTTVAESTVADTVKPDTRKLHDEVFTFVENPPTFKGGEDSLNSYLSRTIVYPKAAQTNNKQGTVFIQFIVDANGKIRSVHALGAPKGYGLEEEAIRVIEGMPDWVPGTQNKKRVAVEFNLPIRFTLQDIDEAKEVFTFVEQPPSFVGGEEALSKYLFDNIKYPEEARKAQKGGTISVQFVLDRKGQVQDVKTLGAPKGYGLEEEAIRVVQNMPHWNPGKQNGHDVNVQYNLPIRFTPGP
ncbi:M56 family metallopeptidase [Chitinophaga vietnamensis]|uniref:M56 family metallopeptidase n=1 Tax=Chitinophaga vietnamensis TaxID=2593957 RepID=UPI001177AB61|nr:M56 family metallopeptidase [Chitinophaga vietnamensis]